jgi:hypothetical protein
MVGRGTPGGFGASCACVPEPSVKPPKPALCTKRKCCQERGMSSSLLEALGLGTLKPRDELGASPVGYRQPMNKMTTLEHWRGLNLTLGILRAANQIVQQFRAIEMHFEE